MHVCVHKYVHMHNNFSKKMMKNKYITKGKKNLQLTCRKLSEKLKIISTHLTQSSNRNSLLRLCY